MIEVKELRHVYNTKSKNKVLALCGVSCTFESQGMYFIVGKSGSGKSTLLNLLGGLDKIKNGDIIVDGVSMKGFSSSDYDAYRASYVGIIFQEFNLLEELTVFQNIELQLNIAGIKATPEMIENSLNKVGLNNYGKRFPYELSGGERQRVAIARQLAKGAKLLLADEPTGNLDSENGENVFNILKKLSKELVVVVVSHDIESAEKYADSIIKIKDGKIESITEASTLNKNSKRLSYKPVKPHFPKKYIGKFAIKNIFKRKIRFIISAFLSIISFAMFGVLGSVLAVDRDKSLTELLANENANAYAFYQSYYPNEPPKENDILQFGGSRNLSAEFPEEFSKRYDVPHIKLYAGDSSTWIGLINSVDDIKYVLGYEMLEGYLPLDENSCYVTDFNTRLMIKEGRKYLEDGVQYTFGKDTPLEDFIGKNIVINSSNAGTGLSVSSSVNTYKIAGIILTDYEEYEYPELELDIGGNGQIGSSNEYSVAEEKKNDIYKVFYYNYDGMIKRIADNSLKLIQNGYCIETATGEAFGGGLNVNKFSSIWLSSYSNYTVLTADNDYTYSQQKSFNANEIVLPLSYYNKVFGENDYYEKYYEEYVRDPMYPESKSYRRIEDVYPEHIGESVTLSIKDGDGNAVDTREFVFGGLVISENKQQAESMPMLYIGQKNYEDYATIVNPKLMRLIFSADVEADELLEIVRFGMEHNVVINSQYTQSMYSVDRQLYDMRSFFLTVGSVFLLISLIMFASYIASTISDKKKEIGIIRAIGGTSKSVFGIFYTLGVIFCLLVSVLSTIAYCIAAPILNGAFATGVIAKATLLYVNPLVIFAIFILSFLVMTVASIIPIMKVSRKSPMQTIRQG